MGRQLYRNASEAVIDMHERGFVEDFELSTGNVLWVQRKIFLTEDEFSVVESHRFNVVAEQGAFVTVHGLATFCSCVKGILIVQSLVRRISA